jgi:photosystem II stability/assembly factor-like uncharacterized protein
MQGPLSWSVRFRFAAAGQPLVFLAAAGLFAAGTWTPQTSGTTARLRGVSAVSESVAWASGANGTVLRTVDGGRTWQTRPVAGAEKLDFRDVDATSERTASVLSTGNGDASRIYKTVDGGATWDLQFTNTDPKGFLDAMAFWNVDRGVVFGDSIDGEFFILLTRDGGRTWSRVPADALPPALAGEGAFAASGTNVAVWGSNHVWIGTGAAPQSRVLRSIDGGRTWTIASTPLASGPSAGIFSIAFADANNGIVVGGDYKKERDAVDNAAITSDGGKTWTLVRDLSGFRSVVAPVPGARASWLAVGPSGSDISTDGGRTWKPIEGLGFHTFSFAKPTSLPRRSGGAAAAGWGAGERGAIARFTW